MASILDAFKEKQTEKKVYDGKKIKVGIIGCGWIAEAHLQSYLKCEDVEVVAFADLVREGDRNKVKEKGLLRSEGKEYVMKDGDVVEFLFNV